MNFMSTLEPVVEEEIYATQVSRQQRIDFAVHMDISVEFKSNKKADSEPMVSER